MEKAGKEGKEGIAGLDERNQGEQTNPSPCTALMGVETESKLVLLQVKGGPISTTSSGST